MTYLLLLSNRVLFRKKTKNSSKGTRPCNTNKTKPAFEQYTQLASNEIHRYNGFATKVPIQSHFKQQKRWWHTVHFFHLIKKRMVCKLCYSVVKFKDKVEYQSQPKILGICKLSVIILYVLYSHSGVNWGDLPKKSSFWKICEVWDR